MTKNNHLYVELFLFLTSVLLLGFSIIKQAKHTMADVTYILWTIKEVTMAAQRGHTLTNLL